MSANIIIHYDPEGIAKRDIFPVKHGTRLLDFLLNEYGGDGFNVPTLIFLGDVTEENEIDQSDYDQLNMVLRDDTIINIVHRPQGLEVGTIIAIITVIAVVVLAPDISPPPTPENPNFPKTNESPNNRLVGQTNVARPLARIPDIYGRMRVYPDLGAKTITEFIGHVKFVTEYLIIGRGEYLVEYIKSGETLISDITSASSTIYAPGDLIPELLDATGSNEVNGQEVKGPNDTGDFNLVTNNIEFDATDNTFTRSNGGLESFSGLDINSSFNISGTPSNDGDYTLKSYAVTNIQAEPPDFDGLTTQTIGVEETLTTETVSTNVTFGSEEATDIIGPFVVPGETDEVWIDIEAPRGLADRRDSVSYPITISFNFILEEIDNQDNVINTETTSISISDNTLDARFYTFKITPANPGGRYRATLQRLRHTVNDASFYDVTKWTRLSGVTRLVNFDQGNVTSIILLTQATDQATKSQERKFNTIVSRKLRTYTTAGGVIIPALAASTKFADAMLEHLTNEFIGDKVNTEIDLDSLYTIQESLDIDTVYGEVIGRFCYSFSAEKASVKDELLTIANACRVVIRKIGNRIEFTRDETRSTRTTIFNTRTKKPGTERKTRRLQKPNGFDGIELQWIYELTSEAFIIQFPDDGSAINPKRIEAAGIRNFKQAWNRAKIEYLKLKLQRETIKFDSTKEGLLSPVGDRVANADGTDVKTQSGEIKAIDGFNVETYTPINFNGNPNATVLMRDESGAVSSEITVTPRLDGIEGFILGALPGFTVRARGDLDYQVGTLYTFALTGETKIKDYVIQKITPKNDGYVTLELTNYDAAIYAPDTETPQTHETTLIQVALDAIPSAQIHPLHIIQLSVAPAETLSWTAAPSGTYSSSSPSEFAIEYFTVNADGDWTVSGEGPIFDTDIGTYRPKVVGFDDVSYEIKITASRIGGMGSIVALGGVIFGSWVNLTGGEGVKVTDSASGSTTVDVTIEIREIATPANTTGIASFTFSVNGAEPV